MNFSHSASFFSPSYLDSFAGSFFSSSNEALYFLRCLAEDCGLLSSCSDFPSFSKAAGLSSAGMLYGYAGKVSGAS